MEIERITKIDAYIVTIKNEENPLSYRYATKGAQKTHGVIHDRLLLL